MFGDDPIELGLGSEAALEARLRDIPTYQELFDAAFPTDADPITTRAVVQALAAFERTLISGRSAFDRYLYDKDSKALSAAAQRGYELFSSEKLECFHCHVGFNLSDHVNYAGKAFFDRPYHNTGLYNIDGEGAYPAPNTGIYSVTGEAADMGRFKAPSLRNIAVTAPYMHDGSIATLSEVLDHYAAGGRTIASGEFAGNGSLSPLKSNLIAGFELSDDERASVLAFFESLTDLEFLSDERFSDPWPGIAAGAR
jgi:cytochrome c peroxidase